MSMEMLGIVILGLACFAMTTYFTKTMIPKDDSKDE